MNRLLVLLLALLHFFVVNGQDQKIYKGLSNDTLRSIVSDIKDNIPFVESITQQDSILIIDFKPEFYVFTEKDKIFNELHYIYTSVFTSNSINKISLTVKEHSLNITFLPFLYAFDYMCPIENGILSKDIYIRA